MSWTTINQTLGLAIIDHAFCQELLAHPLSAFQNQEVPLTEVEQEVIAQIKARDLAEFSQIIFEQLRPDDHL